jgi:hypothetical protein
MPCSPLKVNWRFGGTYRLHIQGQRISRARNCLSPAEFFLGLFYPEDGGNIFLRNVGLHVISHKTKLFQCLNFYPMLNAMCPRKVIVSVILSKIVYTCALFWTVAEIELFHCAVPKLLIRKRYYVLFLINKSSVVLVLKRTIPNERTSLVGKVSATFCG